MLYFKNSFLILLKKEQQSAQESLFFHYLNFLLPSAGSGKAGACAPLCNPHTNLRLDRLTNITRKQSFLPHPTAKAVAAQYILIGMIHLSLFELWRDRYRWAWRHAEIFLKKGATLDLFGSTEPIGEC